MTCPASTNLRRLDASREILLMRSSMPLAAQCVALLFVSYGHDASAWCYQVHDPERGIYYGDTPPLDISMHPTSDEYRALRARGGYILIAPDGYCFGGWVSGDDVSAVAAVAPRVAPASDAPSRSIGPITDRPAAESKPAPLRDSTSAPEPTPPSSAVEKSWFYEKLPKFGDGPAAGVR